MVRPRRQPGRVAQNARRRSRAPRSSSSRPCIVAAEDASMMPSNTCVATRLRTTPALPSGRSLLPRSRRQVPRACRRRVILQNWPRPRVSPARSWWSWSWFLLLCLVNRVLPRFFLQTRWRRKPLVARACAQFKSRHARAFGAAIAFYEFIMSSRRVRRSSRSADEAPNFSLGAVGNLAFTRPRAGRHQGQGGQNRRKAKREP